jgi:hypothetical protein
MTVLVVPLVCNPLFTRLPDKRRSPTVDWAVER